MEDMYQKIAGLAEAFHGEAVKLRRDFHKYPETGWLEMRTSAIIAKKLAEFGFRVLTGKEVCNDEDRIALPPAEVLKEHFELVKTQGAPETYLTEEMGQGYAGVVGILECGEGPTVALRFDIDALPLFEDASQNHRPAREGFASVNHGTMHACGHDAHATIGLGTAQVLSEIKDQLHGTIKLLFQPGEEGTKGAYAMTKKGHLDGVDYFAGTHVAPDNGPDDGDITPGTYGSLATAKYDVFFHGKASHAGGFPEQGNSAILAACHAAVGLAGISRHSGGITRVNVGRIEGGTSSNVVAREAMITMEVRGETTKINEYMVRRAKEVCEAAALMEGCGCEMVLMGHAPSQASDQALIDRIKSMVEKYLPQYRVSTISNAKNWGSEDIGFMMNRVQEQGGQAVYMRTMTDMVSPQHTTGFDLDEIVLDKGITTFSALVYDLLKNN